MHKIIQWRPVDLTGQKEVAGAFSIPGDVTLILSMLRQIFDMPLDALKSGYVKPDKRDRNSLFRAFSYVITGSEEHQ